MPSSAVDEKRPTPRTHGATPRTLRKHAERQLDAFLQRVTGAEPTVDDQGARLVTYGTADAAAFVHVEDGEVMFRVISEVLAVPSDPALIVALMRQILEINAWARGTGRLAVVDNTVVVTATEGASRMADDEYGRSVESVVTLSDAVGDQLRRQFARTTRKRPVSRSARRRVRKG